MLLGHTQHTPRAHPEHTQSTHSTYTSTPRLSQSRRFWLDYPRVILHENAPALSAPHVLTAREREFLCSLMIFPARQWICCSDVGTVILRWSYGGLTVGLSHSGLRYVFGCQRPVPGVQRRASEHGFERSGAVPAAARAGGAVRVQHPVPGRRRTLSSASF